LRKVQLIYRYFIIFNLESSQDANDSAYFLNKLRDIASNTLNKLKIYDGSFEEYNNSGHEYGVGFGKDDD